MATFETAKIFTMGDSIEYTSGGVISKQIIKSKEGNVTLFSFDKGQGLTEHSASYDALVQVIDGEVEIKIDGNPCQLRKGTASLCQPMFHMHYMQWNLSK